MSPIKNLKFSSPYEERELERELRVFEGVLLVVAFLGSKNSAPPQVRAFLVFGGVRRLCGVWRTVRAPQRV